MTDNHAGASSAAPTPRQRVGEYALRIAGPGGRAVHLIHWGRLSGATPAALCGRQSHAWAVNARGLPLCATCALQAEFRGMPADLLYPDGRDEE